MRSDKTGSTSYKIFIHFFLILTLNLGIRCTLTNYKRSPVFLTSAEPQQFSICYKAYFTELLWYRNNFIFSPNVTITFSRFLQNLFPMFSLIKSLNQPVQIRAYSFGSSIIPKLIHFIQ